MSRRRTWLLSLSALVVGAGVGGKIRELGEALALAEDPAPDAADTCGDEE